MAHHQVLVARMAGAEPGAAEVGPDVGGDRAHAIVARRAAAGLHPEAARREVDLVVEHHHVGRARPCRSAWPRPRHGRCRCRRSAAAVSAPSPGRRASGSGPRRRARRTARARGRSPSAARSSGMAAKPMLWRFFAYFGLGIAESGEDQHGGRGEPPVRPIPRLAASASASASPLGASASASSSSSACRAEEVAIEATVASRSWATSSTPAGSAQIGRADRVADVEAGQVDDQLLGDAGRPAPSPPARGG